MNKKKIIKNIFVSLTIISTILIFGNINAFAVGNEYELIGNNPSTGNINKNTLPKAPPPPTIEWYDKINWDAQNNVNVWEGQDGTMVVYSIQSTKDRVETKSKDWKWTFAYKQKEENNYSKLQEDIYDAKKINFIAPKDGYYWLTSTPRVTVTNYNYARKEYRIYQLKQDEDGYKYAGKMIRRTGEVPEKIITSKQDKEQTNLLKDFKIYLKEGEKLDLSTDKKLVTETLEIDVDTKLIK